MPGYYTHQIVRTPMEPKNMAEAIRSEIRQVDPRQPVTNVQPMKQYVSGALARPDWYAVLLGAFPAQALLLAAVGL